MTLARFFAKLRNDAGMSLRDVARKARPTLDPTTPWKVENSRPIRAKSLGTLLRALGLTERDEAYVTAFALWSSEQSKTLAHGRVEAGMTRETTKNDRTLARAVERATAALRNMPEADWPGVLHALERPEALRRWLQSANALAQK